MLRIMLIGFIISTSSYGNATQATPPSCPTRPTSETRGPPGIPGRKGEPGYGKLSKTINKKILYGFIKIN